MGCLSLGRLRRGTVAGGRPFLHPPGVLLQAPTAWPMRSWRTSRGDLKLRRRGREGVAGRVIEPEPLREPGAGR
jgi:hypothetical protein